MKIGVVGAGPAGLHAALALQRDHQVEVFEARDRPGGRLWTATAGYEAGGEWIDADHRRVLASLSSCGIVPVTEEAEYRVFHRGIGTWGPTESMSAAKEEVDDAAAYLARQVTATPWDSEMEDRLTVADFIEECCPSEDRWWPTVYYRSDEGEDLDRIGLLGWLTGYRNYLEREAGASSTYRVPGGMTGWIQEVVCQLRRPLHFHHVLRGVLQSGDQVWLDFGGEAMAFDRVVLAIPPRCLERILFEPDLPVDKRRAIEGCRMGRTIKIGLVYRTRWWERSGWSGYLFTDAPLQQVWPSVGSAALCAYIGGEDALSWLDHPNPVRAAAIALEEHIPGGLDQLIGGTLHDWVSDPYSRGGFSHLAPGYVKGPMQHIFEPVGRIHFAGEHVSLWTGFIEGALESAENVVGEIRACEN